MRVKICGIDSDHSVETALKAGADALGFLVGVTHLAKDKVTMEQARRFIRGLPPFVSSVGVTYLTEIDDIVDMVRYIACSTLQVGSDLSVETLASIHSKLSGIKLVKSVHVTGPEAVDYALKMAPYVDALLLDSRTADRLGGTGRTHDWAISRTIVQEVPVPVILAGGLTHLNVGDAIRLVRPYGVDVNSGVETGGRKDPVKASSFVNFTRKVAQESVDVQSGSLKNMLKNLAVGNAVIDHRRL